ncbi:MAG: calcium-binding protein [Pirellulales bacterium]
MTTLSQYRRNQRADACTTHERERALARRDEQRRRAAKRLCHLEWLETRCLLATAPIDEQFLVAEAPAFEGGPAEVAVHADGGFTVAWESFEADGDGFGVFVQRFDAGAQPVTAKLLANQVQVGDQAAPVVATDAAGNTLVVWASKGADGDGWGVSGRWFGTDGLPSSDEFLVNAGDLGGLSLTSGDQQTPSVAMTSSGTAMVVWQSDGQDGDGLGVFSRILAHPGDVTGTAGQVNVATTGTQQAPDVASSGGNRFVVAWEAIDPAGGADASLDVYGRLFDTNGAGVTGEFKVNTESLRDQVTPSVAMNSNGQIVATWVSEGIPGSGSDVFGQRINDLGQLVGDEFRVNDTILASQVAPAVTMDSSGNYLVAWQSVHQDGFSEGIIGRLYGPNGQTLHNEFVVNTKVEGPQSKPALSSNVNGRAVVTWFTNDETHGPAIAAQRFQMPSLNPTFRVGGEVELATVTAMPESSVAAAMNVTGRSIVVWEAYDADGSGLGVFAQRIDEFGDRIGDPFLVNVGATDGNQYAPAVAISAEGAFVVVWQGESSVGDGYDIFAQQFDSLGAGIGTPFIVNSTLAGDQSAPAIAMDETGAFVVAWQGDVADGSTDVFARRFDSAGTPIDAAEQTVNQFTGLDQVMPTVAMNATGEYAIAWVSSHPAIDASEVDAEKSIFVQWFDATGASSGEEVLVHNYVKDAQESPSIGLDAAGNFVVAWQSINQDGSTWGVYARQFTADKAPVQPDEFQVNISTQGLQRLASVGVEADGRFVVTWQNMNEELDDGSSWDVYRREYAADGVPETGELLVNTWTEGPQTTPVVARTPTGNYGIFWQGQGLGHIDGVHGRLFDVNLSDDPGSPSRIPAGDQFLVGATLGFEISSPAVAINPWGGSTVAFETFEEDGSGFGVFAERFDADGIAIPDSLVQVNSTVQDDQSAPAIASDGTGRVLIVWQSKDEDGFGIYGQWFDASGEKVADPGEFRVNQTQAGDQIAPAVAMDSNGRAVIAWQSWSAATGWDVMYARLDPLGAPGGSGEDLAAHLELAGDQLAASVAAAFDDGQFVVAWQGPGVVEEGEEASQEIFARRYDVMGAASGTEFQVNREPVTGQGQGQAPASKKDQVLPDVAMDNNGDAVFVWQVEGISGSGSDVYGRRMDAAGNLLDAEDFRVNTTISKPQRLPSVAMDASGNYLVAWQSQHQDGFSWGIYGRSYLANGDTVENEFAINELVAGPQTSPGVTANAAGQALVAWLGNDTTHQPTVFGHLYQLPNAEPDFSVDTELVLAHYRGIEEVPPAAAMNARRESVVAWTSYAEDGSGLGVFAQMLDDHGQSVGDRMAVNTYTVGNQSAPAVARSPAGSFVIVWETEGLDGDGYGIYGQRYLADGTLVDDNFQINTTTARDQTNPRVAMAADGSFFVTWESVSNDSTNSLDIRGRRYRSDGSPLGNDFVVNQFTALDQKSPAIAANATGEYVVAWVSDHPAVSDPNDTEKSIFVQWFSLDGSSDDAEVLVHRYVKDGQEAPAVGIDANGRFVVGWQSINQDGNSWGVFARTFLSDKTPIERREFVVNETRLGPQRYVGVGMDEIGRFVISWQSNSRAELLGGGSGGAVAPAASENEGGGQGTGSEEGSSWDIFSRQYSFDGHREGGEIAVNTWTMGPQIRPVVAQAPGGDFGIFWLGQGPDHVEGVHGRLYQGIYDFGDAPDPLAAVAGQYPTLLANNGARHLPGSRLFLGAGVDAEFDGQPGVAATGDDANGTTDDEDGVSLPATLIPRLGASITVTASAAGKLDGWIDFDRDGIFEPSEKIADGLVVAAGANVAPVAIPANVTSGMTYARFRISSAGGLGPQGLALDGEVEDYQVQIGTLVGGTASLVNDPLNPGGKVLLVVGTSGADNLDLQYVVANPPQVKVVLGYVNNLGTFPISAFNRIVVYGQDGIDYVTVDSRITTATELHGDGGADMIFGGSGPDAIWGGAGTDQLYGYAGNDVIWAGDGSDFVYGGDGADQLFGEQGADYLYGEFGDDVIVGGADNDMVNGGRGRNVLIGGLGVDYVWGDIDDDLLIGSQTTHDSDPFALANISEIWRSTMPFESRIANLAALLNRDTVLDDVARDVVLGSLGRDWMIDYQLRDWFVDFNSNLVTGDKKN